MKPGPTQTMAAGNDKSREELFAELQELKSEVAGLRATGAKNQNSTVLRDSEEKFRTLAETSPAAILIHQGKKFVYANPAAENIMGYTKDELLNVDFWGFMAPEYRDTVKERGLARLSGGNPITRYEVRIITKQGSEKWLDLSSARMEYQGRPAILATAMDVTERRRAEKALRLAKFTISNTSDEVFWIEPDGHIFDVNDATCKALGYTSAELGRMYVWDIDPNYPREAWPAHWQELKERRAFTFESAQRAKDGRTLPNEVSVNYLEFEGKEYNCAIVRDITERKRAEEALMKSESDLNRAQEIAHLGSWEWDLASNKVTGSDELYRMFGMTPGSVFQQYIELVVPGERQRVLEALKATAEKNEPLDIDYEVMLRDGARRFIHNEARVSYEDGRPATVFGTVLDITESKRVENELKAAKMQADLYVDLMSHDISNMNQVGMGFLEMALDMLELDEMGREMLLKPKSAFENSSRLVDNVRKLQKVRSGKYPEREMDIGQVLGKVRDNYSKQYGPNVTINYLMSHGYMVKANELLYDLFSNLVENAIKHAKAHPMIDINVKPARENGRDYHKVTVDDRGPGIPDETKAVIFERKLTGDIKSKGSGIGLYMVKTLADIYGGRVWVEDRVPGDHTKGSRFVVMLLAVEM